MAKVEKVTILKDGKIYKDFSVQSSEVVVKTNVGEIKVKTEISTNVKLNENIQVKPSNDNIIIFDGETDKSLKSEFIN